MHLQGLICITGKTGNIQCHPKLSRGIITKFMQIFKQKAVQRGMETYQIYFYAVVRNEQAVQMSYFVNLMCG